MAGQFSPFVLDGQIDFASERYSASREFIRKRLLINRLEESVAKNPVNLHRGSDDSEGFGVMVVPHFSDRSVHGLIFPVRQVTLNGIFRKIGVHR